ncbi:MAG: FxsA family protein [Xanthobacteraceae bacterium]
MAPRQRGSVLCRLAAAERPGETADAHQKRPIKHMSLFLRWIFLGVLVLPLAELAVFILAAMQIGIAATLALTLAASFIGLVLLKIAGRTSLARVRVAFADGQVREADISAGSVFTGLAGILLVVPGFLTDILAFLLLLPPVQHALTAALGRVFRPQSQAPDGVVDLDPGEWNRVEDRGHRPHLPPG